jgi:hypothetical protein
VENEAPIARPAATDTWLREALTHLLGELRSFALTWVGFAFRPARSARAWQAGTRDFMNPLGFAATGAAIYWAVTSVLSTLWPVGEAEADGLAEQLTSAVGPYLHYGLLGAALHLALRTLGSQRRITGSIGAAFFAGGSVGTVTALIITAAARWYGHTRNTTSLDLQGPDIIPLLVFIGAVISYALICFVLAKAMLALHRTAVWKVLLAAVFAVTVTAVLFGSVLPEGNFGWRPYIQINLRDGIGFSFGFRG